MLQERDSRRYRSGNTPTRRGRRRGVPPLPFVLLGVLAGALVVWTGLRVYVQEARLDEARLAIQNRLNLPRQAFELEEVTENGTMRVLLRSIAVLGRAGDTIVAAPSARVTFQSSALSGTGPIRFDRLDVQNPYLRLFQLPNGDWNYTEMFRVEAAGKPVQFAAPGSADQGRPLLFRDVHLIDGRAIIATPTVPGDTSALHLAANGGPTLASIRGRTMQVRRVSRLNATLPLVRVGGNLGWRVEVGDVDAQVSHPDLRITALRGWMEEVAPDRVQFDFGTFRTEHSSASAAGTMRFARAGTLYDVRVRSPLLDFRDLRGLGYDLPAAGRASFALGIRSLTPERISWAVSDAVVSTPESRVAGRFTATTGGTAPWVFTDTRLALEPLDLRTVRQLGFLDLPYTGQIRGTVASRDAIRQGRGGNLQLDLTASLLPEGSTGTPSELTATGGLAFGGADGSFRLDVVRVEAHPFYVAALAPMMATPPSPDLLRGVIRGAATLSGTPRAMRVEDGNLSYEVGDAPATRLTGLAARFSLDPQLRYEVSARAAPLALATLTELFPALPFRSATLSGPINISGTRDRVRFDTDLQGSAGRLALGGTATLGDVMGFDVSGRVVALQAGSLLTSGVPVAGPLSGTVAARGTTRDFHFDVNLAQNGGSFALGGEVRRPGDDLLFDVAGSVTNFRIGSLMGRPDLFPGPMTGPIAVSGGGRQPYRFNVNLRGAAGVFDLQGWYRSGTVPSYAVNGQVSGIDLQQLPGMHGYPRSSLNATIDLQGSGTTPETFAGRLNLVARSSTIGGTPLDAATARLVVADGILTVDTLAASFQGTQLTAAGTWGLTRPTAQPLRFTLSTPNLATLAPLLAQAGMAPPQVAGAVSANGWVSGSFRAPTLSVALRGDGLRYAGSTVGQLVLDVQASKGARGWTGKANVQADAVAAMGQRFDAVRLNLDATPDAASFGVFARRDGQSDVTAAGMLEFGEGQLNGAGLQSLALRLGSTTWQLQGPAHFRWGGERGIEVENLALARTGGAPGLIAVTGHLPPTGNTDLSVRATGVDLADLRRLVGTAPDVQGTLNLGVVLSGPVSQPSMTISGAIDSLRYGGVATDRVAIDARYLDRRLVGGATVRMNGRDIVTVQGTVPMLVTLGGMVPGFQLLRDEPLDVRLVSDSIPLALASAFVPGVRDGQGVATANVAVTGTIDSPRVSGAAGVVGGAITVDALGQRFQNIAASIALNGREIRIDSLVAHAGGTASVRGTISLDQPGRPNVLLNAAFSGFKAIDRGDVARLTTSGQLTLSGRLPDAVLSGRVVLNEGTITIPTLNSQREVAIVDAEIGAIGADTIATSIAQSSQLAALGAIRVSSLQVVVEEGVWLESPDARIQIRGDLLVSRTSETPRVYGTLEVVRGTYALVVGPLRREFDIERGTVQFFGTEELNPSLDIVASNQVRTFDQADQVLTIQVQVTGTLQTPRVALSSNTRPPLPESELLSYLIFGRSTANLGGVASGFAQDILAQQVFGGLLASQLEQGLSRSGLVDYVRVRSRPGAAQGLTPLGVLGLGAPTLEFGKELTPDLFLTLEVGVPLGGAGGSPLFGLGLDWQIDPNTRARLAREAVQPDLLSQYLANAPSYQWSLDVRHRWEWGRPREDSARVADSLRAAAARGAATVKPAPAPDPAPEPAPPPPVRAQTPPTPATDTRRSPGGAETPKREEPQGR